MKINKVGDNYALKTNYNTTRYITEEELERLREYRKEYTEHTCRRIIRIGREILLDEVIKI